MKKADKKATQDDKMAMILWCVSYLWRKGYRPAGAELLKVVPREVAERLMAEDAL